MNKFERKGMSAASQIIYLIFNFLKLELKSIQRYVYIEYEEVWQGGEEGSKPDNQFGFEFFLQI